MGKHSRKDPRSFRKPVKVKDKRVEQIIESVEQYGENVAEELPLTGKVEETHIKLAEIFKNCYDIVLRRFTVGKDRTECLLAYIEGIVDKTRVNDNILKALMTETRQAEDKGGPVGPGSLMEMVRNTSISVGRVEEVFTMKEVVRHILAAGCVLFMDGSSHALVIHTIGELGRSVEQPVSETVVRGPFEAFTERLNVNTALLRKRIKSPDLKMEKFVLGRLSKTDVVLVYVRGLADEGTLDEIRERINRIDTDMIVDSSYIEQFIQDSPFSPFPQAEAAEKPDGCAAALAEGRFVILVDGSPISILVPAVFVHFLGSSSDYYERFYFASFIRLIRYISLLIALLGPSIYIALTTYHQEMIPTPLLINIAIGRAEVPFPAIIEALLMEITFEILREAGVRLPPPVGQAVSIVGALVVGEAAYQAGIVSRAMVIVVAITGIASFTIPAFNTGISIRLLRFPIMFLAAALGVFGIIMGVLTILIHMASLRSVGVPFLSPITPVSLGDWKDAVVRFPLWSLRTRPAFIQKNNVVRMKKGLMPGPPRGQGSGGGGQG